jgi:hypothetical protein
VDGRERELGLESREQWREERGKCTVDEEGRRIKEMSREERMRGERSDVNWSSE